MRAKLSEYILFLLILAWFVLTVFLSYRVGVLDVERSLYRVKLNERDGELAYCLSEIKRLVTNGN